MRRLERAWREARKILAEEGIKSSRVPIERIVRKHALLVMKQMDSDISGMLVPLEKPSNGKRWAIVVNEAHPSTRKRFTMAHELAHLVLHAYTTPHADRGYKLRFRDSRSSDGSVAEEIEANQFAAELLLPRDLVLKRVAALGLEYAPSDEDDSSAAAIAQLAREFEVSKAALSVRLSNLLL
jgi:hypothetical protein